MNLGTLIHVNRLVILAFGITTQFKHLQISLTIWVLALRKII